MKKNKLLKSIIFITIVIFFCAYFIEKTGYYEYKLQNRKLLTEQEMINFEKDIKDGKEVDRLVGLRQKSQIIEAINNVK